jgi:hypothetical protein
MGDKGMRWNWRRVYGVVMAILLAELALFSWLTYWFKAS